MKVLLLLALLWLPGAAMADVIFAEGVASSAGRSVTEARRDALEDALWNASAQLGVTVRGQSRIGEAVLVEDDTQLETTARISRYEIVGEWQEGDVYHVRIRVDAAHALCPDEIRMGAVHFPLLRSHQQVTSSLSGIELGVPNEILHRFSLRTDTSPRRAEHRLLLEEPLTTLPNPHAPAIRERVRRLAQEWDVTHLLAGVIIDISYENIGLIRNTYLRRAEVEIYVFDGETGDLLIQRRASREAKGDVLYPIPVTFGSQRFYESEYGAAFRWVLDYLSQEITGLVSCPPVAWPYID
ncbi:Flagellar assembly protein T, N-terminal domain [Ectothiorhodospira magna]|uniref:Flagellar assembly protein T, N-terminal domain n=1 Tax=Ectothiorhodospira magna TaxID=867345 RepID=A0A1H8Z282_9GAMM|nr:flagellar assembly protein T N-terminal domain-containing protein [Ectothiorhodospira magna]SEP58463.1 Flagellar assembly protein T, N-terminal domain [Ectothiorhodospira magna]